MELIISEESIKTILKSNLNGKEGGLPLDESFDNMFEQLITRIMGQIIIKSKIYKENK